MALTFTAIGETVVGSMRMRYGSFTNGGSDTSGTLRTGLQKVASVMLTPKGDTPPATECYITTTLPADDGITINMASGISGYWLALGW